MKNPVVSIVMITYGHEQFIKEAIEGVLMQICDFEIELIISNDCSPDKTHDIINEIIENDIRSSSINYINHIENIGMIPNFIFTLEKAKGKYIALCEGDDFWTDPLKLQKQVDFLEANDNYVICGHDAKVVSEEGIVIRESKLPDSLKRDVSSYEMKTGFLLLTLSLVFRNLPILKKYPKEGFHVLNGDTFLISILGEFGKFKFMHEIQPSAYRTHRGGVWSMKSDHFKAMSALKTFFYMAKYHKKSDIIISKELFLMTFKWGHSLFISSIKQKLKFSEIIFILKYTIIAHYKIKGLNKTIIFSIKKVFRLLVNIILSFINIKS